jgi:hypothetical protein
MAHIYGQSGAEKELLCEMPQGIYKFEDIKISLTKLQDKLNKERTTFFENLPNLISEEKDKLEFFKRRENEIGNSWDERIRQIEKTIGDRKIKIRNEHKIKLLFTLPVNCVDLFIKKNLSKPYAMRRAKKDIEAQGKAIYLLENEPDQLFQREQKRLIDELNQLEALKKSPDYSGAYGELQVLNELKKLNDGFHIFCDVNITLPNYVRYGRERNLKSAQMDFVLVGPTGIFVIEVKNWSSEYLRSHDGISPHEQVDRAGKVLYIYFKKHTFHFKPEITKLLVPIQRNLNYDWNYKSVFIRDLPDLRKFIWNNKTVLSDTKINKVASLLENLI